TTGPRTEQESVLDRASELSAAFAAEKGASPDAHHPHYHLAIYTHKYIIAITKDRPHIECSE
ncbi:hypothetical protein ACJX0J_017636, partial [Zea mays]